MNFFDRIFKRTKAKPRSYTDDELLALGIDLRNKVLILHMNTPYNKVIISDIKQVMLINDKQYVEFIGYNLNRQCLSMVVSLKTYIKLCKAPSNIEMNGEDEIYLKEIKNLDENKK